MLSLKSPIPSLYHAPLPPTPTSWPWCSPVLVHMKFVRPRGLSSQWWPTRPSSVMAKIKNSCDSRCWRGCGERGTLLHCWDCKLLFLMRALETTLLNTELGTCWQLYWLLCSLSFGNVLYKLVVLCKLVALLIWQPSHFSHECPVC